MKKKILALALVVAMLAIAVVSGSLAWFVDTDKATNTFTIGSVKIEQKEEFKQNSQLLPIVNTKHPEKDPSYQVKKVWVENTGKNDAYVRTFIAVPKALDGKLILDLTNVNGHNAAWKKENTNLTVWVDGVEYVIHCYVYNNKLGVDRQNKVTSTLLKGVYLDASVDVQENPASGKMEFCWKNDKGEMFYSGFAVEDATKVNVLVATQAVQAQGFNNAQQALNAAFGELNNPASLPNFAATAAE